MRSIFLKPTITIAVILTLPCISLNAEDFVFDNVSTKDGLSSHEVLCLTQDCFGMMWIGTDEGLNRYDGHNFTIYKHGTPNSCLNSSWINCLHTDSSDRIWIGTEIGISVFDPHTGVMSACTPACDERKLLSTQRIRSICEDRDKETLWIGTCTGLIKYDTGKDYLEAFNPAKGHPDPRAYEITSITQDSTGILWLGSFDGIYRFDPKDNTSVRISGIPKGGRHDVNDFIEFIRYMEEENLLYVGMSAGLSIMSTSGNILKYYNVDNSSICENDVCDIAGLEEGKWMIGTSKGVCIFDAVAETFTPVTGEEGKTFLLSNYVRKLYRDRGGIVWLGTSLGISKYDLNRKPVSIHPIYHKGKRVTVQDIKAVSPNELWLTTHNGILVCDYSFNILRHYGKNQGLKHDIIKRIYIDSSNTIWVGTNDGLQYFDRRRGVFVEVKNEKTQFKYIYDIKELPDGRIVSNIIDGLGMVSPKRDRLGNITGFDYEETDLSPFLSQSNSSIPYFDVDKKGNIWIGTISDGIIRYCEGQPTLVFGENDGLTSNRIYTILADSNGNVWVGTDLGLNLISADGVIEKFQDDEMNQAIRIITTDAHGRIWFANATRIVMYDRDREEKVRIDLSAQLGVRGIIHNGITEAKGLIFMCGDGFVLDFNPELIHVNDYAPSPVISGFEVLDETYAPSQIYVTSLPVVRLNHNQGNFKINFAVTNFSAPEANRYEYKLEGLDNIWHSTTGKESCARYSTVKPGHYRFVVRGYNSDGVRCPKDSSLEIVVRQPWWTSAGAIAVYVIISLLLILGLAKILLIKFRTDKQLAKERNERLKAEELNELKSEFFTNISHEFKTPLSLIMAPTEELLQTEKNEQSVQLLQIIKQNGERLKDLINRIMELRKIESGAIGMQLVSGNIVAYISKLTDAFRKKAESRNIRLGFETETDAVYMNYDSGKIEKIVFNLLSNACKFTKDYGMIVVQVAAHPDKPDMIVVSVTDNGCGIAGKDLPHIFDKFYQGSTETVAPDSLKGSGIGLGIVKTYVRMHGGDVSVHSEVGSGSTFSFTLRKDLGIETDGQCNAELANVSTDNLQPVAEKDLPIQDNKSEGERKNAVIIEDDKDMLSFLKLSLEKKYNVFTATDGQSGLELINGIIPDFVISDLMMTGMNGYDLCRAVRDDKVSSHIPFIMLTAMTDDAAQRNSYEAGVDVFLTKPFSIATLLTRIETLLDSRLNLQKRYKEQFLGRPSDIALESFDDKLLHELVEIVEKNIADPGFGVQELIEQSRYSYQQIYHKVKSTTGESINEFIRDIRLKRAAQYLANSDMRIQEVMYAVGFNTHSYFTKCFKKYFGCSPTTFAEKHKELSD